MTETLILVRHGEAEGSQPGRLLGRADPPLSTAGQQQAAAVRAALSGMGMSTGVPVFCSPLQRAWGTAAIIAADASALRVDADLQEIHFGAWEGLSYADVEDADPAGAQAWAEFGPGFAFPEGESLADFGVRIGRAAQRLASDEAAAVIAVAHGGVIRALICHFLGLPLRDYLLFEVTPGSVATLRVWGDRGVLTGLWRPLAAGGTA